MSPLLPTTLIVSYFLQFCLRSFKMDSHIVCYRGYVLSCFEFNRYCYYGPNGEGCSNRACSISGSKGKKRRKYWNHKLARTREKEECEFYILFARLREDSKTRQFIESLLKLHSKWGHSILKKKTCFNFKVSYILYENT